VASFQLATDTAGVGFRRPATAPSMKGQAVREPRNGEPPGRGPSWGIDPADRMPFSYRSARASERRTDDRRLDGHRPFHTAEGDVSRITHYSEERKSELS